MSGTWRDYRPAIWLVMLGLATALLINPWYLSALLFGAAIGVVAGVTRRRRKIESTARARKRR